jgi:hypothetical protein
VVTGLARGHRRRHHDSGPQGSEYQTIRDGFDASATSGGIPMIRFLIFLWLVIATSIPASAQIKIEQVKSEGGIKAWLVNEPAIPFIAIEIAFKGGHRT